MSVSWKDFRYRLERLGLDFLAALIPRLSRRACVRLASALGWLGFHCDRRGRAIALANLEAAFGTKYQPSERETIALRSYQNFVRTMIDLFWAPCLTPENFRKYITVENESIIHPGAGRPQELMGFTFHFGNFEWGSIGWGFCGRQASIVTEPFKNARLTEVFDRLRGVSGHEVVTQESSMLRLYKNLRRGRASGVVADLSLPLDTPGAIIDTFGLKMRTTLLHAALALRTGAPLVPFLTRLCPDGSCLLTIYPALPVDSEAPAHEIVQRAWDFFEPHLRREPELWMWAYKHWRYRPADATRDYPFYANTAKKFDRQITEQETR